MVNLLGPSTAGLRDRRRHRHGRITLIIFAGAFAFSGRNEVVADPAPYRNLHQPFGATWVAFVSIVLALSGVEAIANLTAS